MEKFNSFQRLCGVTAYVFRLIANLKNLITKKELVLDPELNINELNFILNVNGSNFHKGS